MEFHFLPGHLTTSVLLNLSWVKQILPICIAVKRRGRNGESCKTENQEMDGIARGKGRTEIASPDIVCINRFRPQRADSRCTNVKDRLSQWET